MCCFVTFCKCKTNQHTHTKHTPSVVAHHHFARRNMVNCRRNDKRPRSRRSEDDTKWKTEHKKKNTTKKKSETCTRKINERRRLTQNVLIQNALGAWTTHTNVRIATISNSNWRDNAIVYNVSGTKRLSKLSVALTLAMVHACDDDDNVCDCRSRDDVHFNFPHDVRRPYVSTRENRRKNKRKFIPSWMLASGVCARQRNIKQVSGNATHATDTHAEPTPIEKCTNKWSVRQRRIDGVSKVACFG